MLIPAAQALDAVTEFFDTNGQRPVSIAWQQDAA
jgi:Immunity protein Imm1